MLSLRRTTLWFGLIGSVSLLSFPAMAADVSGDPLLSIPIETAQPSFADVATPEKAAAPAPIKDAESAMPMPDIPLPDADAAMAAIRSDMVRVAVEQALSAKDAMRDLRLRKGDAETLSAFYAKAGHPLAWSQDGTWTPAARAVVARLKAADEDGLDSADYPLPDPRLRKDASPAEWAQADLKLSASAIRYARDARGGRIVPSQISPLITPKLEIPAADEVLAALTGAKDAGAALEAYNPSHPGYLALKAQLAKLRAEHPSQPSVRLPKGPTLRVGMHDPRVPLIRSRLNMGKADENPNVYDERLASAVAVFQKKNGLAMDGVLGPDTVAALSGPSVAHRESVLIANMERWRWLPADLGERYVLVNVPEFSLRLVEDGKVVQQTRVIVGKAKSQTPLFSENMKYLVINPSWTLPPSILKKEFLPALAADPGYAARKGYKVIRHGNRITVKQPPGDDNALGYIKFIFPNQHSVYLHDTPNRKLFSASKRAFSHGCVRVDHPFELADMILGDKWSKEKLRGLIGKGERYVHLSRPLPVHLSYFTAAVDEKGKIKSFNDIYDLDAKVGEALGLAL